MKSQNDLTISVSGEHQGNFNNHYSTQVVAFKTLRTWKSTEAALVALPARPQQVSTAIMHPSFGSLSCWRVCLFTSDSKFPIHKMMRSLEPSTRSCYVIHRCPSAHVYCLHPGGIVPPSTSMIPHGAGDLGCRSTSNIEEVLQARIDAQIMKLYCDRGQISGRRC